jgi:hypothetical protein
MLFPIITLLPKVNLTTGGPLTTLRIATSDNQTMLLNVPVR